MDSEMPRLVTIIKRLRLHTESHDIVLLCMILVYINFMCITPVLQAILDFFPDIISFQHVLHLGVGRSQIEWKLKVKTQISVFPLAKIGQNDHSHRYMLGRGERFQIQMPCLLSQRVLGRHYVSSG